MKVAIVYDRVNKWGGAERVLLALHKLFPEAPLYTSVYARKSARWASVFPQVIPSFLQKVPFIKYHHEYVPFLMPLAFESFDFSDYDLVISVTSEAAKGIITRPGTKHICYCLTPTRYLWSGYKNYFDTSFKRIVTKPLVNYMRKWDVIAAQHPDILVAISSEVQLRINKYYSRSSIIIFPPVEFQHEKQMHLPPSDNYLLVSRLVSYKKVDLAIKAFNKLQSPLTIVGVGSEESYLRSIAEDNIFFAGSVSDGELAKLYSSAKALVMPQCEDFGLVAIEAQLHGTPVIAYGKGGSLDTVLPNKTGVLFNAQSVSSLITAIHTFEKMKWNTDTIRNNAEKFLEERFKKEFMNIVRNTV